MKIATKIDLETDRFLHRFFYGFWRDLGGQLGAILATFSTKMGGHCGAPPPFLLGLGTLRAGGSTRSAKNFNVFYERVKRITSPDYNPIFDTDFASLVRYDRFPSLLYGSGATSLKIGLWYGGAASSFVPIFQFI